MWREQKVMRPAVFSVVGHQGHPAFVPEQAPTGPAAKDATGAVICLTMRASMPSGSPPRRFQALVERAPADSVNTLERPAAQRRGSRLYASRCTLGRDVHASPPTWRACARRKAKLRADWPLQPPPLARHSAPSAPARGGGDGSTCVRHTKARVSARSSTRSTS